MKNVDPGNKNSDIAKSSNPLNSPHHHLNGNGKIASQKKEQQQQLLDVTSSQLDFKHDSLVVVGLGASAGGLQALESFFSNMPQDSGAAFVIIQHLSPDYKNLMKELLGRCTRMAIHRVEDGMPLEANSVYLIPPGQNLIVSGGHLHLTEQKRLNRSHPNFPINLFFESLAEDFADRSIAIVLSGTGSDGSRGIHAVHEAKGITLVQDPATAEFDGMPQSAIKTGCVDRILPPPGLAQLVYQIVSNPGDLTTLHNADPFILVHKNQLQDILRLLITDGGIDFRQYKATTLSRRIQRRCLVTGFQNLNDYLHLLETSAEERKQLQNDLLISVTQFFRDPEAWQFLETDILPPLIEQMSIEAPLRIWVTACASGEEAYSMAILVDELATAQGKPVHAKIFATDIANYCLDYAAQGVYPKAIARNISQIRLRRYFTQQGDSYEIIRPIRDMIVFAPHNLIKDAGFSRMHLISCRNVLIYMEPSLQEQVLKRLHFSLLQNGILFLGESESPGNLEDEFVVNHQRFKIYSKRRNIRLTHVLPEKRALTLNDAASNLLFNTDSYLANFGNDIRLQEAFRFLVSEQQGCCLIVDEKGHLLHAFGATAQILPPPDGVVSREVIKMVAPPLQLPLGAALNHARKTKGFVHYSAIELIGDNGKVKVNVRVLFQEGNRLVEDFFIVLVQPREYTTTPFQEINASDLGQATMQQTLELESELQRTREGLQATIEELETTNEEQQATNEELIASNEELQSTNEELQSVNEELYTVNAEYQATIQNLTELNNDVNNLLQVSEIAVIFLDEEMRVRKFTSAATQVFALMPSDIGRPINHLAHKLDLKEIQSLLENVLQTKQFLEQKVKLIDSDHHLLMRIYPYEHQEPQTQNKEYQNGKVKEHQNGKITDSQLQFPQAIELQRQNISMDGVVLTFVNVTAMEQTQKALEASQKSLKEANQELQAEIVKHQKVLGALQESEERFRSTFEHAALGIAHVNPKGNFIRVNQQFVGIVGYPEEELIEVSYTNVIHADDVDIYFQNKEKLLSGNISTYTIVNRYIRKNKTIIWANTTISLVRQSNGEPDYLIVVIEDITSQKELEAERDRILQELSQEKELAQVTLHSIGDAVITTDAQARVRYCNSVAEKLTGYPADEAKGKFIQDVVTLQEEQTREPVPHPAITILSVSQTDFTAENLILISRSSQEFTVNTSAAQISDFQGKLLGVVTVFRDVTEARKLSQQLLWQANHDTLTGLVNRFEFERVVSQTIANFEADRRQEHILCYLDLDKFKVVNDTCGHLAGDELLRQVAMLLSKQVHSSDSLARLGGDEFGVLLKNCSLAQATVIAEGFCKSIQDFSFIWETHTFNIGLSIGLAILNCETTDFNTALNDADGACYLAKEQGGNRIYVYQPDDANFTRQRSERQLSFRISSALEQNRFCLYQQPIVSAQHPSTETSSYVEILVRMISSEGELILPNTFIPSAERYGLMTQIDRWVVTHFLDYLAQQPSSDFHGYMLNLSGASFTDDKFLSFLKNHLSQIPNIAQQICFEITETAAISNLSKAVEFINEIQQLGCKFALDDFGSGMSSFGYLKVLPIDYIKIDGSFVTDVMSDSTTKLIVEAINNIGHSMGLQTIAESVEDEATKDYLQEIGVDYLQGFVIATPQYVQGKRI